jgi:hypothetical protein
MRVQLPISAHYPRFTRIVRTIGGRFVDFAIGISAAMIVAMLFRIGAAL